MKKLEKKVESPRLFVIVLSLFLVSLFVLVIGLLQTRKTEEASEARSQKGIEEERVRDDGSLSGYFEDAFSRPPRFAEDGTLLEEDPFSDICHGVSATGTPMYSGFTVCNP